MRVTIAGLGLIGGSIGMALRRRGWSVSFVDPAVSLDDARRTGAADEKLDAPSGELIVLATPADVAIDIVRSLATKSVVTSVASVMSAICDAARDLNFVAGHPFAGSERGGLAAARADLFDGKPWFIHREDTAVLRMIGDCGAEAVVISTEEHDRVLALTSHLPQVLATALASLLARVDPRFVGSGAKSILRLAGSSYDVWRPVLEQNEQNVAAAAEELWRVIRAIHADDFERAQKLYEKLMRG
ncbi:MAG TPA: prephenate dehydrogenase/arogenate dehydrogenase family protein [Thermoanaerobaculia bacterium]